MSVTYFVLPLSSGITEQQGLESLFCLFVLLTGYNDNNMPVVNLVVVFVVNFPMKERTDQGTDLSPNLSKKRKKNNAATVPTLGHLARL